MESRIKQLGKSRVEIEIELSPGELESHRNDALLAFQGEVELDGFRKGKAPLAMVERAVGDERLLVSAAERAIDETYPAVIQKHALSPIEHPEVEVMKLARNNPLVFKVRVTIIPEVKLSNYAEIARKVSRKDVVVDPREIDEAVEWLRKNRKEEGKEELPEVNEEFAKSLGAFQTMEEVRKSIEDGLLFEKQGAETERLRQEILEKVAVLSKVEVPLVLIQREQDAMVENVKNGASQMMNVSFEDYLAKTQKTEAELRESFAKEAEIRVTKQLVLWEIAKKEGLMPTEQEIDEEIQKIIARYPDPKTARERIDMPRLREYTESMLRNQKTVAFLESLMTKQA